MILCAIKSILANQLCHNTRFSSQVPKYNWWKSAFQFRNLSSKSSNSKNTLQMEAKFQKHTNRLINEKSPYLLQHAHNPVDWYPWGEEAIQRAKKENKLIFLSVGYSTCHWCHVMEKESFENEEVAAIMNEHYVNVKVDREERPDIDKLYMTFVLMVNGSGGWPMSVWMTPDLAPITCGTYFPPKDKWGVPGFSTILLKLKEKWDKDKDTLVETGKNVIDALRRNAVEKHKEEPPNVLNPEGKFHQAVNIYRRNIDPIWGGTLGAPKFPEVSKLNLIFHCHQKEPKNKILGLVLNTLDKMQNGGIHDHIFGGFARYSVDKKWHVPHFEKMLYDQGQLLMVYANGYKINRNPKYLEVADKIYTYLVKDLLHPKGGFYSGEDADSLPTIDSQDKVEGAFYAWTYNEVRDIFEQNKEKFIELENYMNPLDVYCEHYNILEEGNVEPSSDPHGHLVEKNVFIVFGSENETAEKFDLPLETVRDILKIGNGLLHEVREQRPRPHLDTKIICGWNGLVLSGISQLATIRDAPRRSEYLKTAENLVNFIRENLFDSGNKKLLRSCYGDDTENAVKLEQPICGFLDDYSFLIKGLLDFYTASLDLEALHLAKNLQDIQDKLFWDEEEGGYFYSEANAENVVVRMKDDHDGAEPCGNSVSAYNLLLLADYFEDEVLKQRATKLFDHFKNVTPFGYVLPEMMSALLLKEYGHNNLIIAGPDDQESHELLDIVRDFYMPGLLIHHLKVDKPHIRLTKKSYENMKMVENKSTAYVCHHMRCHLPTTDPNELYNELKPIHIFEGKHEIE